MAKQKFFGSFSEPDFKSIFNQLPGLYMVLDRDLRIVAATDGYLRATRTRRSEVIGRYVFDVFPDNPADPNADGVRNSKASFDRVFRSGEIDAMVVQRHDIRHPESEGGGYEVRYWSPINAPIYEQDGSVAYIVHRVQDVTEFMRLKQEGAEQAKATDELRERTLRMEGDLYSRSREVADTSRKLKQANEELSQAYERLRKETEEREQLEKQLRHGQKMEALGLMAGGIAHDFNNILAAMIGFTELTIDHLPEGGSARRNLRHVLDAGLRGRDLVRQMLVFSRRDEQERRPVALTDAIKDAEKLLRASIPSTIETRIDIKSESAVLADPVGVQQVLINICNNARDAMLETGGVLQIEVDDVVIEGRDNLPNLGPGAHVRLRVTDTGSGISPDVIDRIFDPFFTTKGIGHGTGLGLSVVHGIVESYGGAITVESEPGKGSTFSVYLPKASQDGVEDREVEVPLPRGRERVLFVDDEELLVEMAVNMMKDLGYDAVGSTSGSEAFERLSEHPNEFDLLITNQTMPGVTGLQLARDIKTIRDTIPIILTTGFSHLVTPESLKAAGIAAFVMKPLVKKELARTIREVLDAKEENLS